MESAETVTNLQTETEQTSYETRVHLLSKEMEDAANLFLLKMAELEKLLPFIED